MKTLLILLIVSLCSLFGEDENRFRYHKNYKKISKDSNTLSDFNPPEGPLAMPAEFSNGDGVFLSYMDYQKETIRSIAKEIAIDGKIYLLLPENQMSSVRDYFIDGGVNMDSINFIHPSDSPGIWIRDYGPFYSYNTLERTITNANYYANHIPPLIADYFGFECFDTSQTISGGNFMTDGNGMGFCSNTEFTPTNEIRKRFREYFGIDSLVCVEMIKGDGTGHIDMASKLVNDTTIFVGSYMDGAAYYSNNQEILDTNAEIFSNLQNLEGRDFRVVRMPMPEVTDLNNPEGNTRSYLNSLIFNRTVLVPIYNIELDSLALKLYRDEMPGYRVVGIDCVDIIQYWGAIHCITNTHFKENPLLIIHRELEDIYDVNEEVEVNFTITPGSKQFSENRKGYIHYRYNGEDQYTTKEITHNKGAWRGYLSSDEKDIEYYLSGEVTVGDEVLTTRYPEEEGSFLTIDIDDSSSIDETTPNHISISQNYPNPFNPTTSINFTTAVKGDIQLSVFNTNGEMVENLVNHFMEKGSYSISFDGSDLNSGVYFYRLSVNGIGETKKMILVK